MQKELDVHLLVTRLAHVPRPPSEGPLREVLRDFGSMRSGSNKNNRLSPRERKKDLTAKVRQQGVGERTRRRRWRATGNKCVQRKEAAERGVNAAGSKGQSGRGGIGVTHDMEKAWKS